jgi:hypothetical protein
MRRAFAGEGARKMAESFRRDKPAHAPGSPRHALQARAAAG